MLAVEALGFRTFLPFVSCPLPKGARELRPLFGPYLFALFDAEQDGWGAITRQPSVARPAVLYTSDPYRPTPIPTALVDQVHSNIGRRIEAVEADAGKRHVIADPVAVLVAIGASVRLVDGLGAGRAGKVDALRRGGRHARVEFEGCVLPVWVPADRLELLTEGSAG